MKQPAMLPITPEDFDTCWALTDRLRRKARRMCAIARIGGFWANLLLLFVLLFISVGLICDHARGSFRVFVTSLPLFPDFWEIITGFVLKPGDSLTAQAVKLVLCAYGSSILLFVGIALVITILYHPRRRPIPEGTYAARTELLCKAAQEAWARSFRTKISTSVTSTILVIVAAFVLLFSYTIYMQDPNAITSLLSLFPTPDFSTNCLIYVLIAYLISNFFSTILLVLTRFIYRYQYPFDFMVQAEAAVLFAREESDGLTPEEVSSRRSERSAAIRDEALELEKEAAYQKAKKMLHEAALLGDIPAMEHYGRHCLLSHLDESARYWLRKALASGEAGRDTAKMLRRLQLRLHHKVSYLRPEAAPLTKGQRVLRAIKTIFTVLIRIFALLLFISAVAVCFLLLTDRMDISVLTDTLSRIFS
jgi:hypothetical protein